MPNYVFISQTVTEINRWAESAHPPSPGIECFKTPKSERVEAISIHISANISIVQVGNDSSIEFVPANVRKHWTLIMKIQKLQQTF